MPNISLRRSKQCPREGSRRPLALMLFVFLLPFWQVQAQDAEAPRVLATVGMVGDVARNVGGECVSVDYLIGSGIDPHLFRASAGDIAKLNDADLILYAGLFLEGQLGEVLANFSTRKPTVAVSEQAVSEEQLIRTDDQFGVDPHIWMDVSLWAQTVPVVRDALAELVPECAPGLDERAQQFEAQLLALHAWIEEAVASIPEQQRVLITAHDAFSYYGRAYGIEVIGIQGISTDTEAGIADIRETAKFAVDRGIPTIFVESTINPRTVQAVVEAAASRGHELSIGDELYSDAMGSDGTRGGTYLGMLWSNTVSITTGLGGELPPLPRELQEWWRRWQ